MKPSVYAYFNAFSLDISLGGMICSLSVAKALNVDLGLFTVLTLGLSIWLIYTFDHLVDSYKLSEDKPSLRHYLHKKYRNPIGLSFLVGIVMLSIFLIRMPPQTLRWGAYTGVLVGLYFLLIFSRVKSILWMKEVSSSVIYSIGIFLPTMAQLGNPFSLEVGVLYLAFWAIVFLNLLVFSLYEKKTDQLQKFESITTISGEVRVNFIMKGLIILFFTIYCLNLAFSYFNLILNIYVVMIMVLIVLMALYKKYNVQQDYHRYFGDGIFYLPAILLF